GRLPQDRERMVAALDAALAGEIPLRPEYMRGL
ncbi:MAG: radical SAM protein, partial [Gemmatimonadales bacterium]|nr:radical SAM protein [Gemmatimonadales bacterium]